MTQAICLDCGIIKIGAFTACDNCGSTPTLDEDKAELYVAFSDWCLDENQLSKFSHAIQTINNSSDDDKFRSDAFFRYASLQDPPILQVDFPPEQQELIDQFLSDAGLIAAKQLMGSQNISKIREKYLAMAPFPLDSSLDQGLFSKEEIDSLKKYGHWFDAMCKGSVPLVTEKQIHFIKAQKFGYEPKGVYERLWYRYNRSIVPF